MMGKRRHRAVEIRGVVYPDANVAAAAVGVQPQTVICAIRNGTLDDCGLGKVGAKPMPIRIRGVDYPNARAAAQALESLENCWLTLRSIQSTLGYKVRPALGIVEKNALNALVKSRFCCDFSEKRARSIADLHPSDVLK